MIFFGLFGISPWLTALLGTSVILSVIYMLRWMQLVYFETPSPPQSGWVDIKGKEISTALFLTFMILWLGIYPEPVLNKIVPEMAKSTEITQLENQP